MTDYTSVGEMLGMERAAPEPVANSLMRIPGRQRWWGTGSYYNDRAPHLFLLRTNRVNGIGLHVRSRAVWVCWRRWWR